MLIFFKFELFSLFLFGRSWITSQRLKTEFVYRCIEIHLVKLSGSSTWMLWFLYRTIWSYLTSICRQIRFLQGRLCYLLEINQWLACKYSIFKININIPGDKNFIFIRMERWFMLLFYCLSMNTRNCDLILLECLWLKKRTSGRK